jgi:hypothetical protein
VELKEIPDFWQSKNTGHLGQQCLEMIAQGRRVLWRSLGRCKRSSVPCPRSRQCRIPPV